LILGQRFPDFGIRPPWAQLKGIRLSQPYTTDLTCNLETNKNYNKPE
jgi:hypothetical protein